MLKVVNLGQIDGVDQGEAGQRAGNDGEQDENEQREVAGELAAAMQGNRVYLLAAPGPGEETRFDRLWGNSQTSQAS